MAISKQDYILRNFSKIKHKKWELYVITRIIHLLNDPEIEFVCQQIVKTPENKRYLTDLFFPTLKLYYEIDEAQHSSDQHIISDVHRQREIVDATGFVEKRIRVFDENINDRSLNEINIEVDAFIDFIKKRKKQFISKNNFISWNYETKYSPEPHLKRGYIDVKDNVVFLNHRDTLRCFGYKKGHHQRATWTIKGTKKHVWFPKLYKNNDWNNSLSDDFKTIEMKRTDNSILSDVPGHIESIVFAHYKNLFGQIVYKFLGEFHTSIKESTHYKWVYIRKQTKINLNEFQ
jgi:very-short-patch-repair endonuclease